MDQRSRSGAPIGLLLALLISLSAQAQAQARSKVKGSWTVGKITQLTLTQGFINLGQTAGLRPGDTVQARMPDGAWASFTVEATAGRAASFKIPPASHPPTQGARIRVRAKKSISSHPPLPNITLPPPESADHLTALWKDADLRRAELLEPPATLAPASNKTSSSSSIKGSLRLDYLGQLNLGSEEPRDYHRLSLYSSLEVPRLLGDWLSYAHRLQLSLHLSHDLDARPFQRSRPYLLVRALRLGLHLNRVEGEFGRTFGAPLSEAALVDGGAVRVRVTPWLTLGGFGGLKPRAEDLRPDTAGAGFGAYASLRFAGQRGRDWSIALDTGFIGSTWRGNTDRQALSTRALVEWSPLSLTVDAVIDLYGEDHPSGLSGADLSHLDLSLDARVTRWLRCGGRLNRYRFVPSRESLELFGGTFVDSEAVLSARGYLDLSLGERIILGAQGGGDQQDSTGWAPWAELMLRVRGLIGEEDLLRLSALFNSGTLLTGYGGRAAYFRPVTSWLSLGGSYSLFGDTYTTQEESVLRHNLSVQGEIPLGRRWLIVSEGQLLLSPEEQILQIFSSLAFYL